MESSEKNTEKKPIYKKWWFWLIIVIVLIAVIGGTNLETPTNTTLSPGIENSNANSTNGDKTYSVGEIYQDNNQAIKFVSVNKNFTDYNQYADVKKGYKIIKAEFEAENLATSDLYFSAYDFDCYADSYDCESFWFVEDSGFSATLSSKKKTKGSVYFQVPVDAKNITIEYKINTFTGEKVEFIVK